MKQIEVPEDFEVVLDVARFRDSLRQLLLRPDQFAIGDLRTRTTVSCNEWIVYDWHPSMEPIQPKKLPPFHRFAVMAITGPRWSTSDQLASAIGIDSDHVGIENLNNLPHASYRDAMQERPKVDTLVRAIHRNQPELSLTGIRRRIQDPETVSMLDRMRRISGLFSFVDNPGGRLAAGMTARQLFVPHLDIGTLIQFNDRGQRECCGDIRFFLPGIGTGCVACVPLPNDFPAMLYSARSPAGTMQRGEPRQWNAERAGSLLHLNASIVAEAIQLWLRYLRGEVSSHWVRALSVSDSPLQFSESPVVGPPDCPVCGTVARPF